MGDFFKNYKGQQMYYFVTTGSSDSPDRTAAGNDYEKIYNANKNKNINLKKKSYNKGHNSMVPESLFDGLQFIFSDYKNTTNYATLTDFRDHFIEDQKSFYGIDMQLNIDDIDHILLNIINTKDEKTLDEYLKFTEDFKLWQNHFMKEPGALDAANAANYYWIIESYEKSAAFYTKAFKELEITVEPPVFYFNHPKMVDSFKKTKNFKELMALLISSKNKLKENPNYLLRSYKVMLLALNFEIAKLSKEEKIKRKEGIKALSYCHQNFVENEFFTLEELKKIEF